MRSSRSYLNGNNGNAEVPKFRKYTIFRLGKQFMVIAFCLIIVSLVSCGDNSGEYRGNLSDASDNLSKVYKTDVNNMKSYQNQKDDKEYKTAMDAANDLKKAFNAFKDIKPSKKFEEQGQEIADNVDKVDAALDQVISGIDEFKKTGDIDKYKNSFEESYKVMEDCVSNLNDIFNTMKAAENNGGK